MVGHHDRFPRELLVEVGVSAIDEAALFDEVDEIGARLDGLSRTLDADGLTPAAAVRLLSSLARVGKRAAGLEALVARRVDASKAYVAAGYRSTEQLVAAKSGTAPAHAAKIVETGRRLDVHAETAEALREGRVSVEQAHAVTSAAEADPGSEGELLALAERESLRRLEARSREVRLAADEDRLGRYRRQHAARGVWHGIDDEGMGWGRWRLPPDDQPVAGGGPTSYENLKPRCRPHHREKTRRDRAGPDPP